MFAWLKRVRSAETPLPEEIDLSGTLAEAKRRFACRDYQASAQALQIVLDARPKHPGALHLQGVLMACQGALPAALEAFKRSLASDNDNPDVHADFGNALFLSGYRDSAELEYRRAIKLAPGVAIFYCSLGNLLRAGRAEEAMQLYLTALELDPHSESALVGLVLINYERLDYSKTVDGLQRLQASRDLRVTEYAMLGDSLLNLGRLVEAELALKTGLGADPENPWLQYHLGVLYLLQGKWLEGFALFEKRREAVLAGNPELRDWLIEHTRKLGNLPPWRGDSLAGQGILVWAEQGAGDTIQLLRLLPELLRKGARKVVLLGQEPLRRLVEQGAGVPFCVSIEETDLKTFDCQCSIMSLPHLLGLEPDTLPKGAAYLSVPEDLRELWARKLAHLPGLKVGIVWQGNPTMRLDVLRSMRLADLEPLFSVQGVSWVSLQKGGDGPRELQASELPVTDMMADCHDFMDTAALIENLDLVLAVDTAVSHLAGALGKPAWLLIRFESEWRWSRDSERTVWYPSMRIFTQDKPRQWGVVIEKVRRELDLMLDVADSNRTE